MKEMVDTTNVKFLSILIISLFLWLTGIIITPLFAASDIRWMQQLAAFLYFFYDPVCHQIADRSFALEGFSLAVCIRCFAVYFSGFLLTLIVYRRRAVSLWSVKLYIFLLLPAVLDFFLEKIFLYNNLPFLRFITGFTLGIALFHLLIVSIVVPQQAVLNPTHKVSSAAQAVGKTIRD